MKQKAIILVTATLLAVSFISKNRFGSTGFENNTKPNLIIILTDDLGYNDVGFMGCKDIPTPNIDRIAKNGVMCTNAYVSYAVCGPSRAGLLTGRYQDRFGFGRNPLFTPNDSTMGLPLSEDILPKVLKEAGYKSVALGKWHLGAHPSQRPNAKGFDDFYGFLSGGHNYFPGDLTIADEYAVKSQYGAYRTKLLRNNIRVEETAYLTDALSREAVHYIDKYQKKPFFMYLAYNAPHTPLQATEKYLNRYTHIKDKKRQTYAAMVSAVDDGVGKVLAKLEETNLLENTIVVFLSDNGGPEQSNGSDNGMLRDGKGSLWEGGIRVPFAMMWPKGIKPNTVFENPVISLDIFATIIQQTNSQIELKNPIDGVNLIPHFNGTVKEPPHNYLFWRKFDPNEFAVRQSTYKYVNLKGKPYLSNISENISETVFLQNPEQKDLQLEICSQYAAWSKQMKDPAFFGLFQDDEYTRLHPDRFQKP